MAVDANFGADDSLRLTSFLRVVKHGIPQRPSRLKRCSRLASEHTNAPVSNPLLESASSTTLTGFHEEALSHDFQSSRVTGHSNTLPTKDGRQNLEFLCTGPKKAQSSAAKSSLSGNDHCHPPFSGSDSISRGESAGRDETCGNQLHYTLSSNEKSVEGARTALTLPPTTTRTDSPSYHVRKCCVEFTMFRTN